MTHNYTTSQFGNPVASDDHSLTAGPDGATVLHDRYLIEKNAQFNRERIPERVVHAKGGGAFGTLTITEDLSKHTRAAVFQPGTTTEMLARFSSVAGEQGSPDTWRDVRGYSLKFYTTEGNLDIVGNNTPVFFIRDGIKFPDFIRSQKRLPASGLRDADMQWDFWTLSPESAHQVTYLMGDRGLPTTWRHMHGFSSHTYQWINAAGETSWVKYHFRTVQGEANMTGAEGAMIAGQDADYYRRDLYEAIERGEYPKWDVFVQIMSNDEAKTYRFNPFDLTKTLSQADFPLIKLGVYELNKNPENFFAQIEQAAFSPANTVPGTGISPDKMLMARVFAYPDAQRHRVGTNYAEIPVNAAHAAPVNSYAQDGAGRHGFKPAAAPVYAPNSLGGPVADAAAAGDGHWESDGDLMRAAYTLRSEDDDFGQAGTLYRKVFTDEGRARFVETLTGQGNSITRPEVLERFFWYWGSVDTDLGATLRAAVGK